MHIRIEYTEHLRSKRECNFRTKVVNKGWRENREAEEGVIREPQHQAKRGGETILEIAEDVDLV